MRVLIYKRTHMGDPDESGCFGINLCMGRVRGREFHAVIGVGGVSSLPIAEGIDRRINWIGIGPHQVGVAADMYPIWAFEKFYLKDQQGTLLQAKAPKLAKRLFDKNGPRIVMVDADDEVQSILKLANRAQPSPGLLGNSGKRKGCVGGKNKNC